MTKNSVAFHVFRAVFPVSKASVSAAAILLAVCNASASADSARREGFRNRVTPPAMTWTGFYAGLNAGYAWDASPGVSTTGSPIQTDLDQYFCSCFGFNTPYAPGSLTHTGASGVAATGKARAGADGGLGGAQIGYNHQFDRFLVGLEADIQSVHARGRGSFLGGAFTTPDGLDPDSALSAADQDKTVDWLGTLRGRLGYLVTPSLLAYATGGLAYGGASAHSNIFQHWAAGGDNPFFGYLLQSSGARSHFAGALVGWTAGGGFEWMFAPNLSLKGEYLYYDLGGASWASSPLATVYQDIFPPFWDWAARSNAVLARSSTRFDGHLVRAGLNYHFNPFAGPQREAASSMAFAWSGFYAGLNAGYGWGASSQVSTAAIPVQTDLGFNDLDWSSISALATMGAAGARASGGLAGGQIGYNHQIERLVFGLEADLQSAHIRGRGSFLNSASTSDPFWGLDSAATSAVETQKSVNWLGTVRGRAGWLATPAILAYATGGLAYGGATAYAAVMQGWGGNYVGPDLQSSGSTGRFSDTLVGWTAGAGFEWMFTANLSLKGEYLYYDLGGVQFGSSPLMTTLMVAPGFAFTISNAVWSRTRFDGHIARVGLNYHFDFGALDPIALR